MQDAVESVDRAIDLLRVGWAQGTVRWTGSDGVRRRCLGAAIMEAGSPIMMWQVCDVVIEDLFPGRSRLDCRSHYHSVIVDFNDHPDTTLEDVILVLKHVRERVTSLP